MDTAPQDPAAQTTEPLATDRECLDSWRRKPSAESLRPLVERYGALVYSSAFRRTGNAHDAATATWAVFLVFARRAKRLRRKTVIPSWLFSLTGKVCRKLNWKRRFAQLWHVLGSADTQPDTVSLEPSWWAKLGGTLDRAMDRLPVRQRDAVLLKVWLNCDSRLTAETLRTSPTRAGKFAEKGIRRLARRLRKAGAPQEVEQFFQVSCTNACAISPPVELVQAVLKSIDIAKGKRPVWRPVPPELSGVVAQGKTAFKLARRVLRSLAWGRWGRRAVIGIPAFILVLTLLGFVAWKVDSRSGHSRLLSSFLVWAVQKQVNDLAEPARPWPTNPDTPRPNARNMRRSQDLFQMTNVWPVHLAFTPQAWQALEPHRIAPLPNFLLPDGLALLRNPNARRNGLAGVLGYEFDWVHADFELGQVSFTNVAVRLKGNMGAIIGPKRSFKVELNRYVKGQKLANLAELSFNNVAWDYSYLRDALGYEFFRDSGVPAPRTALAWVTTTVTNRWARKPSGLYLLVEAVDKAFVTERFGSKETPLFKPVSYHLFADLGDDWSAYAGIYDLKTRATPEQQRRLIEFARLLSSASKAVFDQRLGEFLDLDEFARFLAGEVLLSSYDSILTTGQNFYLYLDPRTNKFGFIPWDLDAAWGRFWPNRRLELVHASIWHPWVGENRFLERVMAVTEFRNIYRARLEELLERVFEPKRLQQRVAEMAAVMKGPIASESSFHLNKFEQEVGAKPVQVSPGETPDGLNHPAYPLLQFITARAKSVRHQLDGKFAGVIVPPPGPIFGE